MELDVIALERGRHAVIHVGTGFSARAVAEADRATKDGLGPLAYTVGGLKALWRPPRSRYRLTLDGKDVEAEGVACMICNAGGIGQGGLTLSPRISMCDGWLDVVVLRDVKPLTLLGLARDLVLGREPASPHVQRWRARTIVVEADPPQQAQGDGNVFGETPLRAHVAPGALRVLVPEESAIWKEVCPVVA
jgi:diacylglycerol kinase family enzyme